MKTLSQHMNESLPIQSTENQINEASTGYEIVFNSSEIYKKFIKIPISEFDTHEAQGMKLNFDNYVGLKLCFKELKYAKIWFNKLCAKFDLKEFKLEDKYDENAHKAALAIYEENADSAYFAANKK